MLETKISQIRGFSCSYKYCRVCKGSGMFQLEDYEMGAHTTDIMNVVYYEYH